MALFRKNLHMFSADIGEHIEDFAKNLVDIRKKKNNDILGEFQNILILVSQNTTVEEIISTFHDRDAARDLLYQLRNEDETARYVITTYNKRYNYTVYFSYDRYAGSYSTGYPCFTNHLGHAETFKSVEDALKTFETEKKHLKCTSYEQECDWQNTRIQKLQFIDERKLEYNGFWKD